MTIPAIDPLPETITIGVLGEYVPIVSRRLLNIVALQGAFIEHIHYLQRYVFVFVSGGDGRVEVG